MTQKSAGCTSVLELMGIFLAGCVWMTSVVAGEASTRITLEQWNSPRSAQAVMAMEPVASAVQLLLVTPQSRLVLTYPSDEEGILWAAELRGWLISLGIASADIEMVATGFERKEINLEVVMIQNDKLNVEIPNHE